MKPIDFLRVFVMCTLWYCLVLFLYILPMNVWGQQRGDDIKAKTKGGKQGTGQVSKDANSPPSAQSWNWLHEHIGKELSFFQNRGKIPREKISLLANDESLAHLLLVKYRIRTNEVDVSHKIPHPWLLVRVEVIRSALERICQLYRLPDMELIVSMHDAVDAQLEVPLFVMAKHRSQHTQILIPDFEALQGDWQVLANKDITLNVLCPWKKRKNRMIWRGSTSQRPRAGYPLSFNPEEEHCLSRIKLCALSARYPEWIDAKFTIYTGEAESIPSLEGYRGDFITYEAQLEHKYQMLIDGNSCPYSASGWKWFSNSLVFKEDSDHIQWYYHGLEPWKHYIPVSEGLGDLMGKLRWASVHDEEAEMIANNAREFALARITQDMNLLYFYGVLMAYERLLER